MLITNPHRLKNKTLSSEQFRCDLIYVISYCIYYTHSTIYYLLGHFNRIYGYRNYSAKSCLQLKHQSHYKAVLSFIFIIRFILITIILNTRDSVRFIASWAGCSCACMFVCESMWRLWHSKYVNVTTSTYSRIVHRFFFIFSNIFWLHVCYLQIQTIGRRHHLWLLLCDYLSKWRGLHSFVSPLAFDSYPMLKYTCLPFSGGSFFLGTVTAAAVAARCCRFFNKLRTMIIIKIHLF